MFPFKLLSKNENTYLTPVIRVTYVEMESDIAAGSAVVRPENRDHLVQEEWMKDDDDVRTLDW
ncbi:hypothetical protein HX018_18285 [Sphingobacterium hotanense]|uniref:Uncharacterized protein n=1 Tax=Sphingobacterium hotanense TaxID=649196 RepID=A0ABT7NSH6_9SPHI|nr:hypothetical protein [Sphingobacterium hotanense]